MMAQRDEFIRRITQAIPEPSSPAIPPNAPQITHHLSSGLSGESMLVDLDVAGVAASSGSACSAGKKSPPASVGHGLWPDVAVTALRFAFPDPLVATPSNGS